MTLSKQVLKEIHLQDELQTSIRLIEIGLGELQSLSSANRAHHLVMQLLSSGFERLMKCLICYGYHEKNGDFPTISHLRGAGHDLLKLKDLIISDYFQENSPALSDDKSYLQSDVKLNRMLDIISEFGKYARYYNLDVVTDSPKTSRDVITEWTRYRDELVLAKPELLSKLTVEYEHEVWQFLAQDTTIVFEKFVRALSRQFTLGRLGKLAQQYSTPLFKFIVLNNHELGVRDYRIYLTSGIL